MNSLTLIVDLDDTLYPADSNLWALMRNRIFQFITYRLHLGWDEAKALSMHLFKQYGTTLRGLQSAYQIDEKEYLKFVHDVPVWNFIRPVPGLREMLLACSHRRVIFTNGDTVHTERVISALELEGVFDPIIDIRAMAPYCKPMPEAFRIMLARIGEIPSNCLLVDDALFNLETAHALGMQTIWVSRVEKPAWVGARVNRIEEAPAKIRMILDTPEVAIES